jgi:hypothetical protein
MPNHMEAIKQKIHSPLLSSHRISESKPVETYRATFITNWDLLAFIKEQEYTEEPYEQPLQ